MYGGFMKTMIKTIFIFITLACAHNDLFGMGAADSKSVTEAKTAQLTFASFKKRITEMLKANPTAEYDDDAFSVYIRDSLVIAVNTGLLEVVEYIFGKAHYMDFFCLSQIKELFDSATTKLLELLIVNNNNLTDNVRNMLTVMDLILDAREKVSQEEEAVRDYVRQREAV
jgi:hypothetical protein